MSTKAHCHLIVDLDIGGTENSLLKTLPLIQSPENHHIVINLSRPGPIGDKLRQHDIQVHDLNLLHPIKFLPGVTRLYRLLNEVHPESLTTYFIYSDLLGRLVGRLAGIDRIYCFQRGALLAAEPLRVLDFLTKFLVTKYLFVSDALRERVSSQLHLPRRQTQTIPNGIVPPPSRRHQTHSAPTITHVGSFKPRKGQEFLLQSLKDLRDIDYHLQFIGSGPLLRSCKALCHSLGLDQRVTFVGQVTEVAQYYQQTDIFVLTSLEEGMSNALLEAMSHACAVIAHHSPENREVVGHTGILVDVTNTSAFAAKLRYLITHPQLRRRLGHQARLRVQHYFHLDRTIKSLQALYS